MQCQRDNTNLHVQSSQANGYQNNCIYCIFSVIEGLSDLETRDNITQNDKENISDVFLSSAENSFGLLYDRNIQKTKQPTWYGPECKIMRKRWHNAKYRYKLNKTDTKNNIKTEQ